MSEEIKTENDRKFLRVKEAAAIFNASPRTIWRMIADGQLTAYRGWRFSAQPLRPSHSTSVVLAAFNNLVPFFAERGWMVAFGFGLLHGFGFANALRDLGLQHGQLAATLFGFNLGVEMGQLAIVAVFFPVAMSLRQLLLYQQVVLRFGSAAIMLVASTWLAERVLDFKWLPF